MLSKDDHDGLISRLYSSAMGETPWAVTLGHAADLFGTSASILQVRDPSSAIISTDNHGYSKDFSDTFFASEAFANDPRVPYFVRVPPGTVYYDHMLYDVEEMEHNRWCRESIDVLKVKYQLGAILRLPDDATGAFTLLSSSDEGHASQPAIDAFHRLAPHIEQACVLGHLVETKAATQAALLDALAHRADGVILLGRNATPTFMNEAAAAILSAGDGIAYSTGTFVTRRLPETRKLQGMLRSAIGSAAGPGDRIGGYLLVTRPSGRRPYVVRVMPAPPTERFLASQSIACVIQLQDLSAPSLPDGLVLREVFGLTEREADFAVELVRCANLERAAAKARMALNTARNHLQSIFRKTGTASQTELVQLLSRLP